MIINVMVKKVELFFTSNLIPRICQCIFASILVSRTSLRVPNVFFFRVRQRQPRPRHLEGAEQDTMGAPGLLQVESEPQAERGANQDLHLEGEIPEKAYSLLFEAKFSKIWPCRYSSSRGFF